MRNQIITFAETHQYVGWTINVVSEKANKFLADNPSAEIVSVQTLVEVDTSGDYPQTIYTHIVTIKYRAEVTSA